METGLHGVHGLVVRSRVGPALGQGQGLAPTPPLLTVVMTAVVLVQAVARAL